MNGERPSPGPLISILTGIRQMFNGIPDGNQQNPYAAGLITGGSRPQRTRISASTAFGRDLYCRLQGEQ